MQMSRAEGRRKHHRDKEPASLLSVAFYWNRKSGEVNSTKRRGGGRTRERERSVCAGGDLLQVLDTLLVNQTDSEGGQVEDEAFLELDGKKRRRQSFIVFLI